MKSYAAYEKFMSLVNEHVERVPCRDSDPDLWFIDGVEEMGVSYRFAVKQCNTCPLMKECADYAINNDELYGIWGGLTAKDRQKMRVAREKLRKRAI